MVSVGHTRKCMACSAPNEVPEESCMKPLYGKNDIRGSPHKGSQGRMRGCSPQQVPRPLFREAGSLSNPTETPALLLPQFPLGFPLWPDPGTKVLEPGCVSGPHRASLQVKPRGGELGSTLETAARMGIRKQSC